jgi:hypothetical protein
MGFPLKWCSLFVAIERHAVYKIAYYLFHSVFMGTRATINIYICNTGILFFIGSRYASFFCSFCMSELVNDSGKFELIFNDGFEGCSKGSYQDCNA